MPPTNALPEEKLSAIQSRRLDELKKQQAYLGLLTPPHITLEIQDLEASLGATLPSPLSPAPRPDS